MAIPRNVNGVNPAKVKRNGAYMSDHQNAFLQSDQDYSLPENSDSLPDFDDAFQMDETRPQKAEIFEEVKNLDESELDKLLGLDEFEEDEQPLDKELELSLNDDDNNEETYDNLNEEEHSSIDNELPDLSEIGISETPFEEASIDTDSEVEENDTEEDIIIFEEDDDEEYEIEENSSSDDNDDNEFENLIQEMDEILVEDENNEKDSDEIIFVDEEDDSDDDSFSFIDEEGNDDDEEETFVFEEIDVENNDDDDAFSFIDDEEDEDENANFDDDSIENSEEIPAVQSLSKKKKPIKEEEPEANIRQETNKKEKSTFFKDLMQRLALMKEQIVADMKGDEIPQTLTKEGNNDEDEENLDDDNDREKPAKRNGKKKRKSKGGNPLSKLSKLKIFSPFIKLYKMLINICFSILNTVLGIGTKLPFIGKLFKPLLAASKTLQKIATAMPIVLVILILILVNVFSVPRTYESEDLPDGAAVSISNFSYDGESATATITNTGETILDSIQADFTVYSMQPSLNPKTWIIPQPAATCTSDPVSIDIESETEISISCPSNTGSLPRVSAKLAE